MDASLYYTDITPDVDLLLQNVTFTVNRPRNDHAATSMYQKTVTTPSSSADNRQTVIFEENNIFTLYNINMSVQKVRLNFTNFTKFYNVFSKYEINIALCRDN